MSQSFEAPATARAAVLRPELPPTSGPALAGVMPRGLFWSATVAITTIVVSLFALVLVPLLHERRAKPLHSLQRDAAEPARAAITALHLALASGESQLRDYRESLATAADSVQLSGFRAEAANAAVLVERLDVLAARWSHAIVDRHVDSVRVSVARWAGTAEDLTSAPVRPLARGADAREATHAEHYALTLASAARLDEAVARGARALQQQLDALGNRARRWTVALAALALAGVTAAVWLGLAVRRAALLAETRRRALADVLESKARFTRGLSHDLKNPLGAIDGHAALLEEEIHGPLTAPQRQAIGRMRRAVGTLLALVDDLLALARAESGELAVRLVPIDLHALLRELGDEHRAALQRAGLGFELVLPEGTLIVRTDAARVQQVLGNLLSNARKYTPHGGRVSLTCCNAADAVQVAVADTGPGIPADRREFVFQEFARLPGMTAPGAGLGLAISRRIARLLGGELWVDAAPPGTGARFVLELQRDDDRELPDADAAQDGRSGDRRDGSRPATHAS